MGESKVEYRFLGKSGLKVSNIALGTMTFGRDKNSWTAKVPTQIDDEKIAHQIMDRYIELGGNFLDTADVYSYGLSEEIVGNWLSKQERDRIVLATKVWFQMDTANVNSVGLSRRHIIESCEGSLKRFKTDYIDLYQSHCWDSATPIEETLRTFDDLIRSGKIRYFGVSNVCGWQMQKIVDKLEKMGLNNVVSLQQQYSLLERQSEFEEFMVCRNEGIGVLPWSPLKGGLLTGKFKKDLKPDESGSRVGFVTSQEKLVNEARPSLNNYTNDERFWNLMTVTEGIASNHGKSISQVALRWLLQQDIVSSVITGVTSVKQLEDNMGAASGWELSQEEMDELSEASPRISLYPHAAIWRLNSTRNNPFIK